MPCELGNIIPVVSSDGESILPPNVRALLEEEVYDLERLYGDKVPIKWQDLSLVEVLDILDEPELASQERPLYILGRQADIHRLVVEEIWNVPGINRPQFKVYSDSCPYAWRGIELGFSRGDLELFEVKQLLALCQIDGNVLSIPRRGKTIQDNLISRAPCRSWLDVGTRIGVGIAAFDIALARIEEPEIYRGIQFLEIEE